MRYMVTFEIEVDDEALAKHKGTIKPPPNDIQEWIADDIFSAREAALILVDSLDKIKATRLD